MKGKNKTKSQTHAYDNFFDALFLYPRTQYPPFTSRSSVTVVRSLIYQVVGGNREQTTVSVSAHIRMGKTAAPNAGKEERFQIRESMFTTAIQTSSAVQAVYSIMLATILMVLFVTCVKYIAMPEVMQKDLALLQRSFTNMHIVIAYEFMMAAGLTILLLPAVRIRNSYMTIAVVGITCASIFVMVFPLWVRFYFDLHEVTAIIVIFEQVRYTMKLISFVIENMKDMNSQPSLNSFLYYLFAPTLIYRHNYPRNKTRNWRNIAYWSCEVLTVIWLTVIVLNRGFLDTFDRIGRKDLTTEDYFDLLHQSCFVACLSHIAVGYTFLHCWLNIWAELLLFGDRMFYKNYLNPKGVFDMLTLWNFLIHSWIKEYLYRPIVKRTKSRPIALILSMLISFLIHDYCICIPLKIYFFYYTVAVLQFALMSPAALLHEKYFQGKNDADTGGDGLNVLFFFALIAGNILIVITTAIRYFEFSNCPDLPFSAVKSFSPFTIVGICHHLAVGNGR